MTPQFRYYREARETIKRINEHKEQYVLIWYARGFVKDAHRILYIGVKPLSGQPRFFSLQLESLSSSATNEEYDKSEKKMLHNFYSLVRGQYRDKIWLHWRMELFNYSFYSGLEDRYKELGGRPPIIAENNIIDLCDLFKKRYGENFVNKDTKDGGKSWRIKYLADINSIETVGFMEFPEEERALENGQYELIKNSLSRKTRIIEHFLDLSYKGKFKTDSRWKDIYGLSLQGIYDACKEKWWFNLIVFMLGLVLGFLLNKI